MVSSSPLTSNCKWCEPLYHIDLTLNSKEDHCVVAMETWLRPKNQAVCLDKPFRVNKYNLSDPMMCDRFQQLMWRFPEVPKSVHIDDHLEQLNSWTRWAARQSFGAPERQPRQKWLSPNTWQVVQCIAPLRHGQYEATRLSRAAFLPFVFAAWR